MLPKALIYDNSVKHRDFKKNGARFSFLENFCCKPKTALLVLYTENVKNMITKASKFFNSCLLTTMSLIALKKDSGYTFPFAENYSIGNCYSLILAKVS